MMEPTSSDEIQQPIYEDPDALLPDETHEAQPEIKVKPAPAPRLKLYQQTSSTSNNRGSSNAAGSITTTATSSGSPAGYQRLKPARPAPKPPANTEKCRAPIKESSQTSNAHSPMMPPELHIKQTPPPPPRLDRFPASHSSYDQPRSAASQRYENTLAHQSRSSSAGSKHLSPVSPALSQESPKPPDLRVKQPPPPPPRPDRFPSPPPYNEAHSLVSQRFENKPPQLPLNPPSLHSVSGGSVHSETCSPHYIEILQDNSDETDLNGLLNWFNSVITSSDSSLSLYGVSKEDEMSSIIQRSMNVAKAWHLYNLLMRKHKDNLQTIIIDFKSICENLSKIKKNNKNMGIAGGTTGAVGGVAAVVGIVLAPVTMGASLIATAVGAGMIATAGGMGAHAAIVSKKAVTRTAVEKLVNDYKEGVADLERCLDYIIFTVMELRRHGIARLESAGAHLDAVRMLYILCNANSNTDIYRGRSAQPGGMSSEKLLQAFTKEMDLYFTEKNGQKLKKSNKSIFSGKVCLLNDSLQEGLDYLIDMWKKLS